MLKTAASAQYQSLRLHAVYKAALCRPTSMPNITHELIENMQRPGRGQQVILRDDLLQGFAVRLTPTSAAYIVEKRVNGRVCRVTLAKAQELIPEAARELARRMLADMEAGRDPRPVKVPTLAEVLEKFLVTRSLRPTSIRHYRAVLNRCIADWLPLGIDRITKEMVLQRHRELTKPSRQGTDGRAQANKAMEILRVLLNFAADTYETDSGEPILLANPVTTLNRNRSWHRVKQRQRILPDHKLPLWYQEVMKLKPTVRDYLLLLLMTGFRRTECAMLRWQENIDFENRLITVRAEATKNGYEHQIPMTDFIYEVLKQRYDSQPRNTQYVFPGRGGKGHIVDSTHVIAQVPHRIGYPFVLHDLRRTFLSLAERMGLSHFMLRRLANHSYGGDVTARYIVIPTETLRQPMQRITDEFLRLMHATEQDGCDQSHKRNIETLKATS